MILTRSDYECQIYSRFLWALTCPACWSFQLSALYGLCRLSCGGHVWPLPIHLFSHVLGHKMSLHKDCWEKSGGVTWCKFLQVMLQLAVQLSKWERLQDGNSNRACIWWSRAEGETAIGIIMRNCLLIHLDVILPFVSNMWFVLNKESCSVNI